MDYRAIQPDTDEVRLLKRAVAQENWVGVKSWYQRNTPWVNDAGIDKFVEEHQKQLEEMTSRYVDELVKKRKKEHEEALTSTDVGREEFVQIENQRLIQNQIQEKSIHVQSDDEESERIPGFG